MIASDRQRYARQILLAEVGLAGQERLCTARVRFDAVADARARAVAQDYLERAGLQLASEQAPAAIEVALPDAAQVRALAGAAGLEEAAAALAGALAAVETIKSVLGLDAARADLTALKLGREVYR